MARFAAAAALVLLLLAGCSGPAPEPEGFHLVVRVVHGPDADRVEGLRFDAGTPARHAFVRPLYDPVHAWENKEEATGEWDRGCMVQQGLHPDCSAWTYKPVYRLPEPAMPYELGDFYPVEAETGQVTFHLRGPMRMNFNMVGASSSSSGCDGFLYAYHRAVPAGGSARVDGGSISVDGPATIDIHWSAAPFDC